MSSVRMAYRALESTNTKTRRLAYVTALLSFLGRNSMGERPLLSRMVRWSQEHKPHLSDYWVQTGEVTSTRRNSAGARYLQLATQMDLVAPVAGAYRATRAGSVLFYLVEICSTDRNPFFLTKAEELFYTYILLSRDADVLLTIAASLWNNPGISLSQLQACFQKDFLHRLSQKMDGDQDEVLRQRLFERRAEVGEWRRPERYAEHIVPPRLNWLLDLGFLEAGMFRKHRYLLRETGQRFFEALPRLGNELVDVTDEWLACEFWRVAATQLIHVESLKRWDRISEPTRQQIFARLLEEAFQKFQNTVVPKVALSQALLYLSIRSMLEYRMEATPTQLQEWLALPQKLNNRRYEVRFSPRENASYLISTLA